MMGGQLTVEPIKEFDNNFKPVCHEPGCTNYAAWHVTFSVGYEEYRCINHKPEQQVKLVWITPEAEKMILYIARVSSDQSNESTGLLRYLIRNKHWSPFEMASMCVEINTTRAISQQIIRHRSFSFQEFSQRYANVEMIESPEMRLAHDKNRQSSGEIIHEWDQEVREILDAIHVRYNQLLRDGVAKETARMILPMCAPTKVYMSGTIRSWIHYLEGRLDEIHTQKEHVDIAEQIAEIFERELPTVAEAVTSQNAN